VLVVACSAVVVSLGESGTNQLQSRVLTVDVEISQKSAVLIAIIYSRIDEADGRCSQQCLQCLRGFFKAAEAFLWGVDSNETNFLFASVKEAGVMRSSATQRTELVR
jgi:hypothetical protein